MRLELRGDNVLLRILRETDATSIAREANDPEIGRFTPVPYPYSEDLAEQFINYAAKSWDNHTAFVFGLTVPPDDSVFGVIELGDIQPRQKLATFGYWIGKEHRRRGYMSEAVSAILNFGFTDLELHRIQAYVDPENKSSRALLEKLGFECEGILRDFVPIAGGFRDRCIYAILAGGAEW